VEVQVSILNYSDYRSYLRDHLKAVQKRNKKFSCGDWARKLGLSTPSALTMILNGQRNPGSNLIERLIRDLKLVRREATFFRELVLLDKCKNKESERVFTELRLAELHPRKEFQGLSLNTFKAISNWQYYAIRELVDLPNFKEDSTWIQKRLRFNLPAKQIQDTIATLVDLGLLTRDSKGKLKYTQQIETTSDLPDEGIKKYHEQALSMAMTSLNTVKPELREISGMTFTLNNKDLIRAKEILRQAQYDLSKLAQNPGHEVYQLEVALFPMTQDGGLGL
jgi:uncharacterized protein (TIGR02147 family)